MRLHPKEKREERMAKDCEEWNLVNEARICLEHTLERKEKRRAKILGARDRTERMGRQNKIQTCLSPCVLGSVLFVAA
jgi:nuclear transport factor 2 (NTF2) superfamily protein